jgi:hypothetical protein
MKKLLASITIFTALSGFAQIIEQFSFPTTGQISNQSLFKIVHLETEGYKWINKITIDAGNVRKVVILNLDFTLWQEIDCSSFPIFISPSGTPIINFSAMYFSQHLFDDDDDLEFLFSTSNGFDWYVGVYNVDGSLVSAFPGAALGGLGEPINKQYAEPISNTPQGTYLQLIFDNSTKFYSLPGTLFDSCCNAENPGIPTHNPPIAPARGMSNAFPNPTYGQVNIDYELPPGVSNASLRILNIAGQIIRSYQLSSIVNRVNLDLSDLSPGNYFYQIETPNGVVGSKQIIKI